MAIQSSIDFRKYINITSGVGGSANVGQRSLTARIFTDNPLLPTNTNLESTNAKDVGTYFGTTSEEYLRAANPYFRFISKTITTPQLISYWFYSAVDTYPLIFGDKSSKSVVPFQFIATGAISITLGGVTNVLTGIDFTAVLTLADVASTLQAAINAQLGTMWTAATVSYEPTRGSFNLVGGDAGNADVSVDIAGVGQEIISLLGWNTPVGSGAGTILSDGIDGQTITEVLENSASSSDNFGSFLFTNSIGLDLAQTVEAAAWTDLQNVRFKFMAPVLESNAAVWSAALIDYSGTAMTLVKPSLVDEYQEMADMTILAATNYNARNATQNYMYQTDFTFTPTVTDTPTSNLMDSLRINYWGLTKRAGTQIVFFQRGFLTGSSSAPLQTNTFSNEQWFKSRAGSLLMEMLLALPKVSANAQGVAQVLSVLQSAVNEALANGTVSVAKELTQTQKLYIASVTGSETAWQQVKNIGYWLGAEIVPVVTQSNTTEYEIKYTFIYSKDDVINTINGSDILI